MQVERTVEDVDGLISDMFPSLACGVITYEYRQYPIFSLSDFKGSR